jgi:tRNA dimethylallyltransferase
MSSSAASDGGELRVICGPTAAGKSTLALALAERFGATIISADSRQVYRGFDVGTAKAGLAEQARVPHRGIDVVEPEERYSAARWASEATEWMAESVARGRTPVIVGGTGLYIRALISGLFEEPPLDAAQRDALDAILAAQPTDALRRWCERVDAPLAHLGRTQLIRAIEIATLTGHRLSDLHTRSTGAAAHAARYLVVDPGPVLTTRIEARTDAMLGGEWQDEVRRLSEHVPPAAPAWKASGYGVVKALVDGKIDLATARMRVVIETRQYAKRQRTWFRNQLPPDATTRLSPEDPLFTSIAERWWKGESIP